MAPPLRPFAKGSLVDADMCGLCLDIASVQHALRHMQDQFSPVHQVEVHIVKLQLLKCLLDGRLHLQPAHPLVSELQCI